MEPTSTTSQSPTTTSTTSAASTSTTAEPTTTTTTQAPTTTTTSSPTTTSTTEPTTTSTSAEPTTTTKAPSTTSTSAEPTTTTTTAEPTTTSTTEAPTTTTTEKPTTTTTEQPTTTTTEEPTTTPEPTTTTTMEPTTTTTELPTTTTTMTTTTAEPTTPGPRKGVFYNETGDYYYPNLVRNGTEIDEEVELTNGPIGFGWAVILDKNLEDPKYCLKMDVRYLNDQDDMCWHNPSDCPEGISMSIWAKITFDRDDPKDRFIYSTGSVSEGEPGMALYFRGIYFYTLLSTGEEMWNLTAPGPIGNNSWYEIGMRWSRDTGLEMFINAKRIAHVMYPDSVSPKGSRNGKMEFNFGCRKNKDGQYVDFAHGEYDELTAWMWALAEDQEHFYLGGHDPNSTCDPEVHPLRCETNLDKILANMDNVEVDSVDGLIDSMNHLQDLSEVQKDPAGSDNEDDKNGDDRNKKEVRSLVAIVEKLIKKTWDKPKDLTVKDLEKLMAVQEIASNVLEEKYIEGWAEMTNEGISAIEFVNKVNAYQMHKTEQTDNGKEPIKVKANSTNILTTIHRSVLYKVLSPNKPIAFPPEEEEEKEEDEEQEGDGNEGEKRRKKRESEGENDEEEPPPNERKVKVTITKDMFGEINKREMVTHIQSGYKKLQKISPLWNRRTGNETTYVFIDSEIVTASSDPNASSGALQREPVLITLKHTRKVKETGRKLMADKDLEENGEIRRRECCIWDPNMEPKGTKNTKGGWTTDSCSVTNTTAEETTCECTRLGTYALLATVKKPFFIPPEDEWVKFVKWIGFALSIILLIFYIIVILIRTALHEQFHIIRLNLAIAALGAQVSFLLSDFLYEDEDTCRILSILIHGLYVATGMWLIAEAHALFSALVNGNFSSKFMFYIMIAWVFPAGMCGGCFSVIRNYGYDYRCLVGPTASMRALLVAPINFAALTAFSFGLLTCINYGTPAVKRTAIVNELSSATRCNFIVVILFLCTWLFGVFAIVDLGFDSDDIPAFNPIFQIMNSFLGFFIVIIIGLGSKHFRYCLCHSGRDKTQTKTHNLDPFDIHDKANISNRKKIYAAS